jgi:hypothetical protein
MALQHTHLEPALLSPEAARALALGPARMMAAKGLVPLPRPLDLLSVLYQLSLDEDRALSQTAQATAHDLPDPVLAAGLSDESVDARVLDRFAGWLSDRVELLHCVIANRQTHGETIADMAGRLDASSVDRIALNEQRLLAHPAIIGAMFHNPRARMSTVDRAVELAARNEVHVPRIPGWESIAAAVLGAPARDASAAGQADELFANALVAPGGEDQKATGDAPDSESESKRGGIPNFATLTMPQKMRLAMLGNRFVRSTLVRDVNRVVAVAAISAPGVTEMDAAKYAGNHSLIDDVVKYIAGRRDWTRSYGIKLALIQNPKTPIPEAIRFMPHLRERDLRIIARSRGVSSAVVAQARKLLTSRDKSKKS